MRTTDGGGPLNVFVGNDLETVRAVAGGFVTLLEWTDGGIVP